MPESGVREAGRTLWRAAVAKATTEVEATKSFWHDIKAGLERGATGRLAIKDEFKQPGADEDGKKSKVDPRGGSTEEGQRETPRKDGKREMTSKKTWRSEDMPVRRQAEYFRPVSITVYCIMVLTLQSLVIYTALAFSRNSDELSGLTDRPSLFTETLATASRSIAYPPMMCSLILGCRMYVLATTEGLGEPQHWAKLCMICASVGMSMQFVIVLALPLFTIKAKHMSFSDVSGNRIDNHPRLQRHHFTSTCSKVFFWTLQILCLIAIYGGSAGVVFAIAVYPVGSTSASIALLCSIVVCALYFSVCFFHWMAHVFAEFGAELAADLDEPEDASALGMVETMLENSGWELAQPKPPRLPEVARSGLLDASNAMMVAVRKAPMLAVLFLATRMRALQLDPPHGVPPLWAQQCFVAAVGALVFEVLVAAYIGASGEAEDGYYGMPAYRASSWAHALQAFFELGTFGALVPIYLASADMHDQDGHLAPFSTTLRCVFLLALLYFGVDFWRWFASCLHYVAGYKVDAAIVTLQSAGVSVGIAPLLGVLFLACRMRALQITQQQGGPQHWAQYCMLLCVFAMALQAITCLMLPLFTRDATHVDPDGNTIFDMRPMVGAYIVTIVKYVSLFVLHGAVISICLSILLITPRSAERGPPHPFAEDMIQWLFAAAVVILASMALGSAKVIGLVVKFAIETLDESILGVDITVSAAALAVTRGYVNVTGLVVHNPVEGKDKWSSPYLARVDKIVVKLNMRRLICSFGAEFEVMCMDIHGVEINFDKPSFSTPSNVQLVLDYMETDQVRQEQQQEQPSGATKCASSFPDGGLNVSVGGTLKGGARDAASATRREQDTMQEADRPPRHAENPPVAPMDNDKTPVPSSTFVVHEMNVRDISAAAYIKGIPVYAALGDIIFPNLRDLIDFDQPMTASLNEELVADIASLCMKTLMKSVMANVRPLLLKGLRDVTSASMSSAAQGANQQCRSLFGCLRRSVLGAEAPVAGVPVHASHGDWQFRQS